MPASFRLRTAALAVAVPAVLAAGPLTLLTLAGDAGAVTATKVELRNGQLRVEGTASPTVRVVVESTTSAASVRADQKGLFTVQASNFTAPDCRLTIRDNSTPTATVAIPNCTTTITPVPRTPAPPSGSCVITAQPNPTTLTTGTNSVFWFYATGCSPAGPLSYAVVAGAIPTGMTVGTFQNSSSGNIIGTPSIRGTYRFTVQVTDAAGATDQENFTIVVA